MLKTLIKLAKRINHTKTAQAELAMAYPMYAPAAAAGTSAAAGYGATRPNTGQGLYELGRRGVGTASNMARDIEGLVRPLMPPGQTSRATSARDPLAAQPGATNVYNQPFIYGKAQSPIHGGTAGRTLADQLPQSIPQQSMFPEAWQQAIRHAANASARTRSGGSSVSAEEISSNPRVQTQTRKYRRGGGNNRDNRNGGRRRMSPMTGLGLGMLATQFLPALLGGGEGGGNPMQMLQGINQQYQNRRNMLRTLNQYYMNPLFKHFGEKPEIGEELRSTPRNIKDDPYMSLMYGNYLTEMMRDQRGDLEKFLNNAFFEGNISRDERDQRLQQYDQQIQNVAREYGLIDEDEETD